MTKVVSAATVRHSTHRKMVTSSYDKGGQCCNSQALDKTIDVNDDNIVCHFFLHPVKCENTGGRALGRKYDILASFIGSLLKLETWLLLEIGGGRKKERTKSQSRPFQKIHVFCVHCNKGMVIYFNAQPAFTFACGGGGGVGRLGSLAVVGKAVFAVYCFELSVTVSSWINRVNS